MFLMQSLLELLETDVPSAFERFGDVLDADWIEDALIQTGTASVRHRKLSAQRVVWLVIAMALFRDRSIQEVVSHIGLVLPNQKERSKQVRVSVAPSAIPQGRYRLGEAPLQEIFSRMAETWAEEAADQNRWRGLALYGVDGTTLRVPDTEENREAFSLPPSIRGQSSYPQVRLVALMALRSHLIRGVSFGPCSGKQTGEQELSKALWQQVPEESLVVLDRGFINYSLLYHLSHDEKGEISGKKHWLIRGMKNLRMKTIQVFGKGDELVEIPVKSNIRKRDPSLPKSMIVRAIRYQIKGFSPQILLTSLTDPKRYPSKEVSALYHERWELEIGYDEIKTHLLEREEALRSKKAEGIRQEIWGIFLAYNLVRKEMLGVAEAAGVPPVRVSFRHSLQFIRVFCIVEAWTCAPGNLPKRLISLQENMSSLLILPERRPNRLYKRQVKIKMSSYKRNPGKPQAKVLK